MIFYIVLVFQKGKGIVGRGSVSGQRGQVRCFGLERCIGCRLCEFCCPCVCIEVRSGLSFNLVRYCRVFFVVYRRCIFCGFCVHVCPVDAIVHSDMVNYIVDLSVYCMASKDIMMIVNFIKERYDGFVI